MTQDMIQQWNWAESDRLNGRLETARQGYQTLCSHPAWAAPAHLRLACLDAAASKMRSATAHILAAVEADPDQDVLAEAILRQLFALGEIERGLKLASNPVLSQTQDVQVAQGVAELLTSLSLTGPALEYLGRARALGASSAHWHYQAGLNHLYAGTLEEADENLSACLQRSPGDPAALWMCSRLSQNPAPDAHLQALREAISRRAFKPQEAPLLYYAMFKELDAREEFEEAWRMLETGMRLRRLEVDYDASAEASLFGRLEQVRSGPDDADVVEPGPSPIFIVGQPRSGTTLLERILSGHSEVADAGELQDFNAQMNWLIDVGGWPRSSRAALTGNAALDWSLLGRRYLEHTRWRAKGRRFYTDKLPSNFINAGFIAKALPQARIIHMRRDPVEVGFSNLKVFFGNAYPHSYSQDEMAHHLIHYERLMRHWSRSFPGRILEVSYSDLVTAPEQAAQRILSFCQLPWEPGVLEFSRRSGAIATASTVQVREGIHRRYLGHWRSYARQLAPLRARLEEAGLLQGSTP